MYRLLADMRVVEAAAFVAAPLCALNLAQMGAEVIRIDTLGGGPDARRWPLASNGASLYWEGLNKGKRSVAIDLSAPEGRELAQAIITAPGEGAGLFVTNYPAEGFLAHDRLALRRADLITVRIMGWADRGSAVDYTVNAALGIPLMTGPAELGDEPVNHVLPAWDIAAGNYAAFAFLAAERRRTRTGAGADIRVPLGDIAMATIANLGQVAEVSISGEDRPRYGNDLFGAFGRDFASRDGRRVMVVALTRRHWADLVKALNLGEAMATLEAELGVRLADDEGLRFQHRARLNPLVAAAIGRRTLDELRIAFQGTGVCWGPYNHLSEIVGEDGPISKANPLFATIMHPSGHSYPTPGAPGSIADMARDLPGRAPRLGEHTEAVLAELLGLTGVEIGRLHDRGVVAGPVGAGG